MTENQPAQNPPSSAEQSKSLAGEHLLFGMIGLQLSFLTRDQLVAAFDAWIQDKSQGLAELLVRQGALTQFEREVLDRLVKVFLEKHSGNTEASLEALSSVSEVRPQLERLGDPELAVSLGHLGQDGATVETITMIRAGDGSRGRFRIVRPHAQGGLGSVSVAIDQELNREVALKEILPRHADDPASRERFVLEAEITGGLEHPGIVPVYALGQSPDGRPFYAMRFIKGDSLKTATEAYHRPDNPNRKDLGARQLELRQLLGRFIDVCNAMEYAHSRGVLHRDIKPGNIMVGKYGETLVVDWGLAKAVGRKEIESDEASLKPTSALSSSGQTQPGSAIGTPAYMSPEQARGDLDRLGPTSDVYSLGATLYHVLCGKPPIEKSEQGEMLANVQKGAFPRPRAVLAEIPLSLEAICLKAMSLKPEDRYQAVKALAADVEKWLADEPVVALCETLVTRASRWLRKHRAWTLSGTAALAIVAAIATLSTVLIINRNQVISKETDRAERHLYLARMRLAQAAWESGSVDETRRVLKASLPEPFRDDLRGFEWFYWDRLCRSSLNTWRMEPSRKFGAAVLSGDGKRLVTLDNDEQVRIWETASGKELAALAPLPDTVFYGNSLSINRDGSVIVTACQTSPTEEAEQKVEQAQSLSVLVDLKTFVQLRDGQGKELHRIEGKGFPAPEAVVSESGTILAIPGRNEAVELFDARTARTLRTVAYDANKVALSPDGTRLVVDQMTKGVTRVIETSSGKELSSWPRQSAGWPFVFSPDNGRVTVCEDNGSVQIHDTETGQSVGSLVGHSRVVDGVAWSRNGQQLATASDDGTLRTWDANSGKEHLVLKGHVGPVWGVSFQEDRQRLISVGSDQSVSVWDGEHGQTTMTLAADTQYVLNLAFRNDGKYVVSSGSDGRALIWNLDSGKLHRALPSVGGHTNLVQYSPDGKHLVTVTGNVHPSPGSIHIWDPETGKLQQTLKGRSQPFTGIAFSGDGRRLASAEYDGFVRIWDFQNRSELQTLDASVEGFVGVTFHPDGNQIVILGENKITQLSLSPPAQRRVSLLDHESAIICFALNPDGTQIATGGEDTFINVSSLRTGALLRTLTGHSRRVFSVAFSRDGKRLASASADGTVRVWDVESGMETLTLKEHPADVFCVAFSPDSQMLASSDASGLIKLWDARPINPQKKSK